MRVTLEVTGPEGAAADGAALDLREWLRGDPELRPRIEPVRAAEPEPGAMGALGELVALLLQPGGLTVTLAAGVVAWLRTRRGTQTVTITRPDGTQITVASEGVRGLTYEAGGELAQRLARALEAPPQETRESQGPPESRGSQEPNDGNAGGHPAAGSERG
ncbi:hypothetical protein ACGFRB_15970 [Streptomyces sp. NPDC048718]|uniref:effector-associated constant component EACC1 n=1 Tax=Streptomyces sp. NPDC048718 TaxID=3365587 RepID=UPI003710FED7